MPFVVTVKEVKPVAEPYKIAAQLVTDTTEQIFEQRVETLDLKKVIDAVNYKRRERSPNKNKTKPTPATS